uniref:Uncharacterized protein n=1 Tax=Gopherus evgoodei TaxID=1825980 RepID=A0A8C4WQU4_9SAUR
MALQVSALALLLALPPLLSAQGMAPSPSPTKTPGTCRREGAWTTKVTFPPEQTEVRVNDTVLVTCAEEPESGPFPANCTALKDRGAVWDISGVKCLRMCNDWVRQVDFDLAQTEFGVGAEGRVTCRQQFQQNSFSVTCRETESGRFEWDLGAHKCVKKCEISRTWDSGLQFAHEGQFYALGDSLTLNCSEGYWPSPPVIKCVRNGSQAVWSEIPACRGVCTMAGNWPPSVSAASARTEFAVGESVLVTCRPEQYEGSPAWVRCTETAGRVEWDTRNVSCVEVCTRAGNWPPSVSAASPQTEFAVGEWVQVTCRPEQYEGSPAWVRCTETAGRVEWDTRNVSCVEKCPRPQWDPRLRFVPDQPFYGQNEHTTLSCSGGFQPSLSVIRCVRWGQTRSHWNAWSVCAWGACRRITENVTCAVTPRIIPGSLEISPTTIKLHWTCEPPKSCQGSWKIRAQCQLDGPLSGPCQRQRLTREQLLQGLDGTVTCSSLHPFTSYRVTIFGGYPATRPPSTVLYRQRVTTSETAPDKPEIEPLDLSTKTLKWKQLLPCKGAIIGYQLNITAWREYNSDFLEVKALRVNQSVTKYLLHPWRHGTNYTVTIQGLTAAGLGQASHWDFETDISEPDIPTNVTALSIYSISPSSGTALLPLQPFPELHGPIREYQIIVSAMQNGSEADTCRSPGLQPFNSSLERDVYLAAVLPAHNLTGPTDFVLGNGARHYGYYNAPLRPHRNYTAFVRVVSRWKQMEKSSCVRYDFSVGEAQTPQPGGLVLAVAVPVLVLLAAGALLLWFVLARKKPNDANDHKSNGTIPLKRNRGAGASRLRTEIPVAELLESLKRFKRAEMEEEEGAEDDANPERPPAGRNAEYQTITAVWCCSPPARELITSMPATSIATGAPASSSLLRARCLAPWWISGR